MAYRMVYLRIRSGGYNFGWTSDGDRTAFKEESRRLFQELGWTLHAGHNGVCDTVTKGDQDLYLHPLSFSGVLDEANIQPLLDQLSKAQTFSCYHIDCYEEYLDIPATASSAGARVGTLVCAPRWPGSWSGTGLLVLPGSFWRAVVVVLPLMPKGVKQVRFIGIDNIGDFEDEKIFWISLTDPPAMLKSRAALIDGEAYSDTCFAVSMSIRESPEKIV